MSTITIGVDLAKQLFSTCEMDASGRVRRRQEIRREALGAWLAQWPAGTDVAMEACSGAHHWARVRERIAACDARIASHARQDERCVRLRAIIGIGPITADAVVASVGSAREFANGRQMAAWLGLVPTQHSSGGHDRLGVISCQGDVYLRTLLIQGARSSLQRAQATAAEKRTPEQIWIGQLACRLPFGKVLVAIANKHARQLWVMLAREEPYDPHAWLKHPMVQRPAGPHAVRVAMP